jgi:serine-type D-Ala-D-Ala carboxypeptidase (penicillin-binding protein 5/6)
MNRQSNEPPFLSTGYSRYRASRRRTRRYAIGGSAFALLLVAVGILVFGPASLQLDGISRHATATGQPRSAATRHAQAATRHGAAPSSAGIPSSASIHVAASSSRVGLPLGTPPLPLSAASDPADVLAVSFRHEPRAGLVFDLDSGRVLWQLQATRVLPIASLAKMMTALLVVRSLRSDAQVFITRRAVNAAGSKVGLLPLHRRVPLGALLYGLLLPSGNDAAVALAEAVSGSVGGFVDRMNAQAARLGLGCTRLTSPDGLDNGNSSCAVDLAELAYADLVQPRLAAIVRSASAIVPFPVKGGKLYLYNNNPLLRYRYPGATGLKTGETEAAGLCLVGTAERHHVRLGVVLLHSPELGRQAELLLNRAFEDVYHQSHIADPPIPKGR